MRTPRQPRRRSRSLAPHRDALRYQGISPLEDAMSLAALLPGVLSGFPILAAEVELPLGAIVAAAVGRPVVSGRRSSRYDDSQANGRRRDGARCLKARAPPWRVTQVRLARIGQYSSRMASMWAQWPNVVLLQAVGMGDSTTVVKFKEQQLSAKLTRGSHGGSARDRFLNSPQKRRPPRTRSTYTFHCCGSRPACWLCPT